MMCVQSLAWYIIQGAWTEQRNLSKLRGSHLESEAPSGLCSSELVEHISPTSPYPDPRKSIQKVELPNSTPYYYF